MTEREELGRGTILRGTVGSTVHGLDGGYDDRDAMAVGYQGGSSCSRPAG